MNDILMDVLTTIGSVAMILAAAIIVVMFLFFCVIEARDLRRDFKERQSIKQNEKARSSRLASIADADKANFFDQIERIRNDFDGHR